MDRHRYRVWVTAPVGSIPEPRVLLKNMLNLGWFAGPLGWYAGPPIRAHIIHGYPWFVSGTYCSPDDHQLVQRQLRMVWSEQLEDLTHRICLTSESNECFRCKDDSLGFPWSQRVHTFLQRSHGRDRSNRFDPERNGFYFFVVNVYKSVLLCSQHESVNDGHGSGIDCHCRHLFVTFVLYYAIMACRWADTSKGVWGIIMFFFQSRHAALEELVTVQVRSSISLPIGEIWKKNSTMPRKETLSFGICANLYTGPSGVGKVEPSAERAKKDEERTTIN